ncbi:PREDICTED: uncharacterized protein C12orf50 homolog [Haliaeetus leucocephalus]|uniref:uncharacterized protein C12orf50 homolog n=1 Tax=Haliaeetus leucocephalus TaxID=52644 RepID=UPI00053CC379|nr:PREDICTED: uncharacterized protein C12orf50 homolog [Haliaeetus leucocephalus]
MAAVGNDRYSHFHSPYAQRKYSNVPCFWETQPVGCVRFNCAFHHSKPRNINGLFLPPTNSAPLQQGIQGGILPPAHCQELLRNQKNIVLPIHPPVIININDDDDDEEDDEEDDKEEENRVPEWVPRTAADLEEERAIKEICYKSGEYYGIQYPHEHQSTKTVSAPRENELLPLEATEQHLQKETNHTELVESHHYQEVQEEKGISEEPRNSPNTGTGKGIRTSDPKVKPRYQQRRQRKDDETASSYIPYERGPGGKTYFNSSEPRRSAYVVYRTVTATQEPKFSGSTDKYTSGSYNAPNQRKRNPHAKTFSKSKTTIQSQEDMEVNRKGERYIDRRKR